MQRRITVSGAAAAAAIVVVAGCSSSGGNSPGSPAAGGGKSTGTSSSPSRVSGTITVLAASSLEEAFTTLGKQFEKAHPGTTVRFSFGASSDLAAQINQGAPADVFASAAPENMNDVIKAGNAAKSTDFVKNRMEIAVPPSNPGHVRSVKDLARSGLKVAVCEPQVPCGAVAAEVFKNAHIKVGAATLEPDVKSTLSKVELDEVDAGMVYVTDVRAAGNQVKGVAIPANLNATTEYPIATLEQAPNPAGAQAFEKLVLSPAGREVLIADGFQKP